MIYCNCLFDTHTHNFNFLNHYPTHVKTSGMWLSNMLSCSQCHYSLQACGRGSFSVWTPGFSFLFLSESADKRPVRCQANSPQLTGYRLDDREQIKQKDECSPKASGSISDGSDPQQFLVSLHLPFFLCRLALFLLSKVTVW